VFLAKHWVRHLRAGPDAMASRQAAAGHRQLIALGIGALPKLRLVSTPPLPSDSGK
jgi:hypothetical protein